MIAPSEDKVVPPGEVLSALKTIIGMKISLASNLLILAAKMGDFGKVAEFGYRGAQLREILEDIETIQKGEFKDDKPEEDMRLN